ncbi:QWRF motif-containing protein 2-like [Wolffia australiana]
MVAVVPASPAAQPRRAKSPSLARGDGGVSSRPPLNPSEKDNTAALRRPRAKEVTSRYLSPSCSTTSSSSSSSARAGATSTCSSSSSSSSSFRRCPSPLPSSRPSTPSGSARPTPPKRAQSVDRPRPTTPRSDLGRAGHETSAAKALCTTTRSLSVSFQGGSFFYQTSKAKTTPQRKTRQDGDGSENSRPADHLRWPAARSKPSVPLSRSLDFSSERRESMVPTALLLQRSVMLDDGRRASIDVGEFSASSDTESVSSGSNSGAHDSCPRARTAPRGVGTAPARFWQDNGGKARRLTELGFPIAAQLQRISSSASKLYPGRKLPGEARPSSPVTGSSPLRRPVQPSSPSRNSSPLRMRSGGPGQGLGTGGQPSIAPSMIDFASDLGRTRKGELRVEEAHLLRLLHNRHLQWLYINARASSSLSAQKLTAERLLYSASVIIADLRDSVDIKRINIQMLVESMKLSSILKSQMVYLEDWSFLEEEHFNSLNGATEALRGSILRLPIVAGAKADVEDVKDAVRSAVGVMQAMGNSIISALSKVESTCSLVSELAKVAAQEQALLDQSRDLLSVAAAMHVKQSSLRGQLLQLRRRVLPGDDR